MLFEELERIVIVDRLGDGIQEDQHGFVPDGLIQGVISMRGTNDMPIKALQYLMQR